MINCKDLKSITSSELGFIIENELNYYDGSITEEKLKQYCLEVKKNYCKIHKD